MNNEHVLGVGSMSSGGVSFSCLLELCKVLTIAEDDYKTQCGFGETDLIELLQNFLNFKNGTPSETDLIAFTSKFKTFPPADQNGLGETDLIAFTSKFQNFQNPPGD